jgi:hypothetical protein
VARNRKRPRGRTRQPGSPEDPGQGLPTRTKSIDNGAPDLEPENGTAELEPVDLGSDSLEPVDLGGDSLEDAEAADDDLGAEAHDDRDDGAPPPLEHAMPDAELAEEQLSVGRPEEPEPDEGEDEDEFEREVEESISKGGGGRRRRGRGYDGESGAGAPGAAVAEKRPNVLARFIGFLQGSWRAPTSTVAGPSSGLSGHGSRDRVRDRGRGISRSGGPDRREVSHFRIEVSATGR